MTYLLIERWPSKLTRIEPPQKLEISDKVCQNLKVALKSMKFCCIMWLLFVTDSLGITPVK